MPQGSETTNLKSKPLAEVFSKLQEVVTCSIDKDRIGFRALGCVADFPADDQSLGSKQGVYDECYLDSVCFAFRYQHEAVIVNCTRV